MSTVSGLKRPPLISKWGLHCPQMMTIGTAVTDTWHSKGGRPPRLWGTSSWRQAAWPHKTPLPEATTSHPNCGLQALPPLLGSGLAPALGSFHCPSAAGPCQHTSQQPCGGPVPLPGLKFFQRILLEERRHPLTGWCWGANERLPNKTKMTVCFLTTTAAFQGPQDVPLIEAHQTTR